MPLCHVDGVDSECNFRQLRKMAMGVYGEEARQIGPLTLESIEPLKSPPVGHGDSLH